MITILDEMDRLTAILANDESDAMAYTANKAHEKLNDAYKTYSFRVIPTHEDARHLVGGHKVVAKDQDGVLQPYIIKTVEDVQDLDGYTKEVYAEHVSLELNGVIIRPQTFNGVNAEQFITQIIGGTRWKIGVIEWFGIQDMSFTEYTSGIDAIIQGAEAFGGEFAFRAEMSGGRLSGLYIDLVERRGTDTGIQITHEHNLTSIKRIEDASEVYTALIGIARGEGDEGYTTFTSISADDKPMGQDWIGSDDALQNFGIIQPNGERQHFFGVYQYEGNERITPDLLLIRTRQKLKEVISSKFTYECSLVDLGQITGYDHEKFKLGDSLAILNTDFEPPLLVEARIIEMDKGDDIEDGSVVMGYYRDIWNESAISQIESLRNTVMREAGKWDQSGLSEADTNNIARAASYRVDQDQLSQRKISLDTQAARITASPLLKTQTVIDRVDNAKVAYDARYAELEAAITNAVANDHVTDEENLNIQNVRASFVSAESEYSTALEEAESDITANTEKSAVDQAEKVAETTVTQYAERKIYRGIDPPTDPAPVKDDLWIDITDPANPVWMQFDGTIWNKMTRNNLSEMLGQLKIEQIPNVSITTEKLVDDAITEAKLNTNAVGLDALQNGVVNSSKLADLAVEAAKLANLAVESNKVGELAVTSEKLYESSVVESKLAALSVGTNALQNTSITSGKIGNLAVGSGQIANLSILNGKLGALAVDAAKLAAGSVQTDKLNDLSVSTSKLIALAVDSTKLKAGSVLNDKLANLSVDNAKMVDLSVDSAKLSGSSVTSEKIANLAVGSAAINNAAITSAKIDSLAVGSAQLQDASIVAAKIKALAVGTAAIQDVSISSAKIALLAVGSAQIQDTSISSAKIGSLAVGSGAIQDAAISSAKIDLLAVGSGHLQNASVVTAKINNLAVGSAQLADVSITSGKIASLAVGSGAIQDAAITNAKVQALDAQKITTGFLLAARLASNIISSDKLAANSIVSDKLAANSVTIGKLGVGSVTADTLAANSVIAGKVGANAITANELAANSVQTNHISSAGIDAGVLMAGTVISKDITFTGTLSGADGTFSGDLIVGDESQSAVLVETDVNGVASLAVRQYTVDTGSLHEVSMKSGDLTFTSGSSYSIMRQNALDLELTPARYFRIMKDLIVNWGLTVSGETTLWGLIKAYSDLQVSGRLRGVNTSEVLTNGFYTDQVETGWCGVGGYIPSGVTGVNAGAWQQFRTRKNYVPSTIAISTGYINGAIQANLSAYSGLATTAITEYGFWVYIQNQGSASFRYWRGTYSG